MSRAASRSCRVTMPMRMGRRNGLLRRRRLAKVHQELAIALAARDGRGRHRQARPSYRSRLDGHARRRPARARRGRGRCPWAPRAGRLRTAASPAPRRRSPAPQIGSSGGRIRRQRDERHVDGDDAGRAVEAGQVGGGEVAGVHALDDGDARVGAQLPVQLAVADVDGDRRRGAPRASSTSVKPPVEAPMSSAEPPGDVEPEGVERVGQLDAAAADPGMIRADDARPRRARTPCVPALTAARPLDDRPARRGSAPGRVRAIRPGRAAPAADRGAASSASRSPLDDPARDRRQVAVGQAGAGQGRVGAGDGARRRAPSTAPTPKSAG